LSHLARSDFFPTGKWLPEAVRWISWGTHHLTRAGSVFYWENLIRPLGLSGAPEPSALEAAEADFHQYAPVLDDVLAGRAWLVDDRITYADFRVATVLPFAAQAKLPIAGYLNILKWHDRLTECAAWRDPFDGLA
jgi:glutathione S-transferase